MAITDFNMLNQLGEETEQEKGTENLYSHFELRATEIKETEDGNRQLIMELWGNDIEFKRI